MPSRCHDIVPTAQTDAAWSAAALRNHNQENALFATITAQLVNDACENMLSETPIAEIGAGIGYVGSLISEEFQDRYIQTEIGPENCKLAQEANPALQTLVADAKKLPFRSESIGGIIARNVLDMADTKAVAREAARVLQPDGHFVHIRDRRPNLAWLQQQMNPGTKWLLPHFNIEEAFQNFQVVSNARMKQRFPQDHRSWRQYTNPHLQETVCAGVYGKESLEHLRSISEHVRKARIARISPSFTEITEKAFRTNFEQEGMTVQFGIVSGEADISRTFARELGFHEEVNRFTQHPERQFVRSFDASLPDNIVRLRASNHVMVAIKGGHNT